jgi:ABC-type antimicrobial peptide transport system permease subunit
MGFRLALGATARQVLRLTIAPGLWLCAAGITTGLVLGFFTARLVKSMIWGVTASDPLTLAAVALLLLAITLVANFIPAFA